MTIQEKNSLIWQFHNHKTRTFLELKQRFPLHLIALALLGDNSINPLFALKVSDFIKPNGERIPMFHAGDAIRCRVEKDNFRDTDIFKLTEYGENILYLLEKEELSEQRYQETLAETKVATNFSEESNRIAKQSLKEARLANRYAIISIFVAAIAIAIAISPHLKP